MNVCIIMVKKMFFYRHTVSITLKKQGFRKNDRRDYLSPKTGQLPRRRNDVREYSEVVLRCEVGIDSCQRGSSSLRVWVSIDDRRMRGRESNETEWRFLEPSCSKHLEWIHTGITHMSSIHPVRRKPQHHWQLYRIISPEGWRCQSIKPFLRHTKLADGAAANAESRR